jgi:4-hydroxy-2-oxoheptanedioate aldolase
MTNILRDRLNSSRPIYGCFVTMRDPAVTEIAALAGYDFVIIDMEHAALDLESVVDHLRAARARGIGAMVRMPARSPATAFRLVEEGAEGILIPHVHSPEVAQEGVNATRYAPIGQRGIYDATRAADYSAHSFASYKEMTEQLNSEMVVMLLIEDREGVDRIDEILAVPGIDVVSYSLGVYGSVGHPVLGEAIETVRNACRRHQVRFGMPPDHGTYPISPKQLSEWGVTFLFRGSDCNALVKGFRDRLGQMKTLGTGQA